MGRTTDKRSRLIEAAKELIHVQGFNRTTLADIADAANVPLGNVYYYFKTKVDIGFAVIEKIANELKIKLSTIGELESPAERLQSFLQLNNDELEKIAQYGCPIGSLCHELTKQGGLLAEHASKIMKFQLNWVEEQFQMMGFKDSSHQYAVTLISGIQGGYLLTQTFSNIDLSLRQTAALQAWLDNLPINVHQKQAEPA